MAVRSSIRGGRLHLLIRAIARRALSWRYRNFKPEAHASRWVEVGGLRLWVPSGVFDPALHFTSEFLASYLRGPCVVRPGSKALDLGTGSGIVAMSLAEAGAMPVVAIDISQSAVEAAQGNVRLYHLEDHISVRHGAMFEPVHGERFDLIVCNPPYFRGTPSNSAELAYKGGANLEWFDRFAAEVGTHLATHGQCLLILGEAAEVEHIIGRLQAYGWRPRVVARRNTLTETLYILVLERRVSLT